MSESWWLCPDTASGTGGHRVQPPCKLKCSGHALYSLIITALQLGLNSKRCTETIQDPREEVGWQVAERAGALLVVGWPHFPGLEEGQKGPGVPRPLLQNPLSTEHGLKVRG